VTAAGRALEGLHAVVTGGGRGIGAATARALGGAGANLTLIGRSAPHLEATANQIASESGVRVQAVTADITDSRDVQRAFEAAHGTLGAPRILVNNAGQAEGAPFIQTSRQLWDRMMAVNLTAAFECTKLALPAMLDAGHGRIVNVASSAGLRGVQRVSAYAASKHGLIGLTRSLALEVAKQGVTVNAVCPGYVDTDMATRAIDAVMTGTGKSAEEATRMISRPSALGRLLSAEEVAGVILWLCSPAAATITGQAIVIGGDII
jgi:NAD(P)-dependent dehydrogenase (short-subunit alcohol dehydrogenase family)